MSELSRKRRRDIGRQRWQFLSVLATVALGVMLFGACYDAYRNLNVSYQQTYDRLKFADATVSGADDQDKLVAAAKAVTGVQTVATRQQSDVPFRVQGRIVGGRMVGIPAGSEPPVNQLDVVEGSYPATNSTSDVLVESHFAAAYDLKKGDALDVLTRTGWLTVHVAGVAVSPEYLWPAPSNQEPFVSSEDWGVLFVPDDLVARGWSNALVHQALVLYEPGANTKDTNAAVQAVADDSDAESVVFQDQQPSNKALQLDVNSFQEMSWLFPALFLGAAGLAMYLLLTRVVYSQRNQIGTLRANGITRRAVLWHYLSFGLWVGLWGAAAGSVLGLIAGWALTGAYTSELGIPDTVTKFYWFTPFVGFAFGFVAGVISAWVPARQAVNLDPAEAMRGEVAAATGSTSLLERAIPALSKLPIRWLMVLRGFRRNPRRSVSTVIGIVLALVLVLASWALLDTVQILIEQQFTQIQLEDATVTTIGAVNEGLIASIGKVSGVRRAEQVNALDVTVTGPKGSYDTQLQAFDSTTTMHGFIAPNGKPEQLPPTGLMIGKAIEGMDGVKVGDGITVKSSALDKKFSIPISGAVVEPLGTLVYCTRDQLDSSLKGAGLTDAGDVLNRPGYSMVFVQFDQGVDRTKVLDAIRDVDGVAVVSDSKSLYDLVQQYMAFFYVFLGFMLVFGGAMALALIFNTVSVNLAERSSELACMRANGMSAPLLGRLVLVENMVLTAVAIIPGLVLGTWVAAWFLSTYSSDMMTLQLRVRPTTYVLASLAMFAITGLSLVPGIREIRRLDVARVVRERSQ